MISTVRTLLPLLILWFFYFSIRVIFTLWNWNSLTGEHLFSAFMTGLRFDMVAICYLNSVWIIANHMPDFGYQKFKQQLLKIGFWLSNAIFIILNFIDIEMINFTGRRVTHDFVFLLPELDGKVGAMLSTYLLLIFICIVTLFALWKSYPRKTSKVSIWALPIVLIIATIGARGGTQLKPLGTINATVYSTEHLNALAHNSTYSFLASYIQRQLMPVSYFSNWNDVQQALPKINPASKRFNGQGQNVVILIMESFASEYMGHGNSYSGYTPFLDELAKKGVIFENAFANGRRSMDAVPSILAGIPSMTNESYITTNYKAKTNSNIGKILKASGYKSSFFHGGHNGTMFFDSFSHSLGINEYHGFNEFPDAEKYSDGSWGAFDEPFLEYMAGKLDKYKVPFVATFFSLTSHHPYKVPEKYADRFPKGSLEIHESIGYADYALRNFFKRVQTSDWYQNTLFIITADHASKSDQAKYQGRLGKFKIPIVLYHPGMDLSSINVKKVVQQTDILPTVLDFLQISAPQLRFGESMFTAGPGRAIMNLGSRFFYVEGENAVESVDEVTHYFKINSDETEAQMQKEMRQHLLTSLRAYIQYYRNGLLFGKI